MCDYTVLIVHWACFSAIIGHVGSDCYELAQLIAIIGDVGFYSRWATNGVIVPCVL